MKQIHAIGIASGLGGNNPGCRYGPVRFRRALLTDPQLEMIWEPMLYPRKKSSKFMVLAELQERIIRQIVPIVDRRNQFVAIDGDHSSAMGIWQGVIEALHPNLRFGLLWIDAHSDLHDFTCSASGNVHSMPLAALLGQGDQELSTIYGNGPCLEPENLVMLGLRTVDLEERQLMKQMELIHYDMDSVRIGGFQQVFHKALSQLRKQCDCYGISLDLAAIDPIDGPGVGTLVPDGLSAKDLCQAFKGLREDKNLIGIEIAEYNPLLDRNNQTLQLIVDLLLALFGDAIRAKRLLGFSNAGISISSRPTSSASAIR